MTIDEIRHTCEAYGASDHIPAPTASTDDDDDDEEDFEADLVRNANEIIGPSAPGVAEGDFDTDISRPCKYSFVPDPHCP